MFPKFILPTKVVELTTKIINTNLEFINLKEIQKIKLMNKLLSLWFFIFNEQTSVNNPDLNLFFNIHDNILNKFRIKLNNVDYKFNKLLIYLEQIGLIDINHKYSIGNFSKSYKVNLECLQETHYTQIELDFDKIFRNIKNKTYWLKKYPDKKLLIQSAYNTTIDMDNYIYWMNNNIGTEINPILNKRTGRLNKRYLTPERIYYHLNLAIKVNFQNIWFKLSDEGRFYSSISNLPNTCIPF